MDTAPLSLAIETSSRRGEIALGRGDALLETAELAQGRRHNLELMPAVEAVVSRHGGAPAALRAVYVALGPGSFTGLRVAVATAKVLAWTLGCAVVGVPSLEVLAQNAAADARRVAVALDLKRDTVHCGVFERDDRGVMRPSGEARLRTLAELLAEAGPGAALLGDPLPDPLDAERNAGVERLPAALAQPRAAVLWRLGREREAAGVFADPLTLAPLYIREPEAVTLWKTRHA